MENKIERIHSQRKKKAHQTTAYTLLGMTIDRDRLWLWVLLFPIYFTYWLYQKIKKAFQSKEFNKEKFRKWFERPHNFKHFIFFWDNNSFCISIDKTFFSNFARKLKKWRKFTPEVYQYLLDEYEIEGYKKEICEGMESCQRDIDFYKKDSQ